MRLNPRGNANTPNSRRQMKVWLSPTERAVVTAASQLRDNTISDYMRRAILEIAIEDAKEISPAIEALEATHTQRRESRHHQEENE